MMGRGLAVLCVPALLAACAPIGVSTPQTFDERLASGVATVSAVRTTTTALYRESQLSAEDAQRMHAQADSVREGIEAARGLHATDPEAGNVRLTAEASTLEGMQKYLNSKRPVPCMPLFC